MAKIKTLNTLQHESVMGHDIRFDPSDAQPIYIGINQTNNEDTTAVNWVIYKFTYTGSDATRIQKASGSWDSRATLF